MPLHYGQPNKNLGKRIITIVLSVFTLLLAVAVMLVWMFWDDIIAPAPYDPLTDISEYEEPLTAVNSCLVILDFPDVQRFVLVQSVPSRHTVHVVNIPTNLALKDTANLSALLSKHGSLRATQAVADTLGITIDHYVTWTYDGAHAFLKDLERGVRFALPEDVNYTDENGTSTRLKAGEQQLSGVQVSGILRYNGWKDTALQKSIAAEMVAAVLNQYVVPEQHLNGYFAALADTAQTDLRIDNFNAFRRILTHLADSNSGSLCQIVPLIGVEKDGRFVPDLSAMRTQTHLYLP